MSEHDVSTLRELLAQEHKESYPSKKLDDFFEIFCAEQVLKSRSFDLDQEEILSGVMGSGHTKPEKNGKNTRDGGIDGFYVFANRRLIREDTDLSAFQNQQITIDVVAIQAKNSPGFGESALTKMKDFASDCLRLSAEPSPDLVELYREELLNAVMRFKILLKNSLIHKPSLNIAFYYGSLGSQISSGVKTIQSRLAKELQDLFSTAVISVDLFGATKLLSLALRPATHVFSLETAKFIPMGKNAHVCLIELGEFYKFIDDNGAPRESLFEANVRDHVGDVRVNVEISATLAAKYPEDFWWLNNGITVIANDVSTQGDVFLVTDPLIVNGLQTSYELHKHFHGLKDKNDKRKILIRIIRTVAPDSIDRIIKATNSQTRIPSAWLHATEDIHRKIEISLRNAGYYYDRRKNFYKNQGKPTRLIITIPYLSQALAAILLQKPDDARARPTTIVEKHYKFLFPSKSETGVYVSSVKILKRVNEFLEHKVPDRGKRLNLVFYLAMYATGIALRSPKPQRKRIASFDLSILTDDFLEKCYTFVESEYLTLGGDDRVAKGSDLSSKLKSDLVNRFSASKKASPKT